MPPRKKSPTLYSDDSGQQSLLGSLLNTPDATGLVDNTPSEPERQWLSVGELTQLIVGMFKAHPQLGKPITVKGELSNVKRSSRGHIYLTLKDEESSISAVIWASMAAKLPFDLDDGLEVFASGKLDVYPPNGTYSLVIQRLEPVGVGALQLAYEKLKTRLSAEGLFDEQHKQDIPQFAQRIGIVTSSTGAVIHDMLRVIRRKNEQMNVVLAPAKVQGQGAADDIARAIRRLNSPKLGCDTIIVARGGGSFEDLFCFSEEPVVRAIFESRVPVITGIGHEPDFGLADAVADVSASTPTAAAEAAVYDLDEWRGDILYRSEMLVDRVQQQWRWLEQRFDRQVTQFVHHHEQTWQRANDSLTFRRQQLTDAMLKHLQRLEQSNVHKAESLNTYSPLSTLSRGYSITLGAGNSVISHISDVKPRDRICIKVTDGQIMADVVETQALS